MLCQTFLLRERESGGELGQIIALVSMMCLSYLDGRDFNVNSRRPQYQEVNGSDAYATSYAPLQSNIATAVSLAA